jgi:hypothetical protein
MNAPGRAGVPGPKDHVARHGVGVVRGAAATLAFALVATACTGGEQADRPPVPQVTTVIEDGSLDPVGRPQDLVVGSDGTVYLAFDSAATVGTRDGYVVAARAPGPLTRVLDSARAPGFSPEAMAVDPATGDVYVGSYTDGTTGGPLLWVLAPSGEARAVRLRYGSPDGPPVDDYLRGLAFDPRSRTLYALLAETALLAVDPQGIATVVLGEANRVPPGVRPAQTVLDAPFRIAVDPRTGALYGASTIWGETRAVCSPCIRIDRIDRSGGITKVAGGFQSASERAAERALAVVADLAVDARSGDLYISAENEVLRLSRDRITAVDVGPKPPGQAGINVGQVALDADGNLYVELAAEPKPFVRRISPSRG